MHDLFDVLVGVLNRGVDLFDHVFNFGGRATASILSGWVSVPVMVT